MLNPAHTLAAVFLTLAITQPAASQQASWTTIGAGCPGAQGVPLLAPLQNSLPFTGEAFLSEVTNLPISGVGVGIVGLSDTTWLGTPLPVDLGPLLAMPGCVLYTDIRRTKTLSISGGRVTWPVAMPDLPSLNGVNFFQQAFILDPSVPGLGAVVSNAGRGVIENFNGNLTVKVLGGAMGTSPQVGVRVLRHDLGTGAVMDDQLTGVDGIVDFGTMSTSRTTFSVVVPPPFPSAEGFITTVMNARVGDLTILNGPKPGLQASFNVDMTGVPLSADEAYVFTGGPDEGYEVGPPLSPPPTVSFANVDLHYLQPDGKVSFLTQAGIDGAGVTSCGMVLDVDPATIAPGSTLFVPTSTASTNVPFTANESVHTDGSILRRSGLIFETDFFTDAAMSGSFPICPMPGADKYGFFYIAADLRGAGYIPIFNAIPASMNITMPDMTFHAFNYDFATRSVSWTVSGPDLTDLDMGEVFIEWMDPMSGSYIEWNLVIPGDASNVTLPQLPGDLGIFEPPVTASTEVEFLDFDVVTGYDDFITAISAMGGNLVDLAMTGTEVKLLAGPLN